MTGTIKKIMDGGKQFGFISSPEITSGKDLFFHANNLVGVRLEELHEGDSVSFEMEDGDKGPNAINVQRA